MDSSLAPVFPTARDGRPERLGIEELQSQLGERALAENPHFITKPPSFLFFLLLREPAIARWRAYFFFSADYCSDDCQSASAYGKGTQSERGRCGAPATGNTR